MDALNPVLPVDDIKNLLFSDLISTQVPIAESKVFIILNCMRMLQVFRKRIQLYFLVTVGAFANLSQVTGGYDDAFAAIRA